MWGSYKLLEAERELTSEPAKYVTDGSTCFVCLKLYHAKYRHMYTLAKWKEQVGCNRALNDEVQKYTLWLVAQLLELKDSGLNLDSKFELQYPDVTTLQRIELYEVIWTMPEDVYVELSEYPHGDPRTNERGDVYTVGPAGVELVKIQSERRWKRTRRIVQQAKKQVQLDNSQDAISNAFVDESQTALAMSLGAPAHLGPMVTSVRPPATPERRNAWPALQGGQESVRPPATPALQGDQESVRTTPRGKPKPVVPKQKEEQAQEQSGQKKGSKQAQKKGRPAKDNSTQLREGMLDLKNSSPSSKRFFGPEWPNVMRNWDLYRKGVQALIEEEESEAALVSMEALLKQSASARRILCLVSKKGVSDPATLKAYEEEMAWLSRAPVVDNPFPVFLHEQLHDESLAKAWPASSFAKLLQDTALLKMHGPAGVPPKQKALLNEKIMLIVVESESDQTLPHLQELSLAFGDQGVGASCFKAPEFHVEVTRLRTLAFSPTFPEDKSRAERLKLLTCALGELSSTAMGEALRSSKKGRDFVSRCEDNQASLVAAEETVAAFGKTWTRFLSAPLALEDLEKEAKLLPRDIVLEVVEPEEVNKLFDEVVRRFRLSFVPAPGGSAVEDINEVGRQLWLGEQAPVIHACPGVLDLACSQYQELRTTLEKKRDYEALDGTTWEEGVASKTFEWLHLGASKMWRASAPHQHVMRVCGEDAAKSMVQWFIDQFATPKGKECRLKALKVGADVLDSAKHHVLHTFKKTTTFDFNDDSVLHRLMAFKLQGDVAQAVGTLNRWDEQVVVALELQFVQKFGQTMACAAALFLERKTKTTRKERKLTEDGQKAVTTLRSHLQDLKPFMASLVGKPQLFASNGDGPAVAMGPICSMDGVQNTLEQIEALLTETVTMWIQDLDDLVTLVSTYIVQLAPGQKDAILQEPQAATLEMLLDEARLVKTCKGAALLATWKSTMRKLNQDGHGACVSAIKWKSWQCVQDDLTASADLSRWCTQLTRTIPMITNRPKRIVAAKDFETSVKGAVLGSDLEKQLTLLKSGEGALSVPP